MPRRLFPLVDAADCDDASEAALRHAGEKCFHQGKGGTHVRIEFPCELLRVELRERPIGLNRRVQNQDIRFFDCLNDRFDSLRRGEVGGDGLAVNAFASRFHESVVQSGGWLAGVKTDLCAGFAEEHRNGAPDSAAGTRHQRSSAFQIKKLIDHFCSFS